MKSFDDLINEYHMSKITFQRRMKLIPDFKKKYCKRGKYNKLLVSDKGVKLITYEKHNSTSKNFHTRHGKNDNVLTKSDLIDMIHQLLSLNAAQKRTIRGLKLNNHQELSTPKVQHHLRLSYMNLRKYLKSYNSKGAFYRLFHKV